MSSKENLVNDLFNGGLITKDEKELLLEEKVVIQNPISMPIAPIIDWLDCKRPRTYGDICPCNPANGGHGVCSCILGNKSLEDDYQEKQPVQPFYQHQITCQDGFITKSEFVKIN